MHLESLVEEESVEEGSVTLIFYMWNNKLILYELFFFLNEDGAGNVMHETPRRILILKTEGSRFAFSDYVFPGESPQEALNIAGEILNLSNKSLILYDTLEKGMYYLFIFFFLEIHEILIFLSYLCFKGRHLHYETLPDVDGSPLQNASTVTSNNKMLFYFAAACLLLAVSVHIIKKCITLI